MKTTFNLNDELKKQINFEQNRQLNNFSLNFFKKLKQNIIINEYWKYLIATTEPKSIFLEILFKYFKSQKFKKTIKKLFLIGNLSLISKQAIKFNFKKKLNVI